MLRRLLIDDHFPGQLPPQVTTEKMSA